MDYNTASLLCAGLMLFLLLIGVPIAYALGFSSIVVGYFAFGSFALQKAGWTTFQLLYNLTWTPLPLFTLMSFLIAETRMGEHLFRAARNWMSRLPGGLFVAAIMGEAGMAAALGASGPTIIAVGNVAVPEFKRYSYSKAIGLGALTSGGVLGPLIPPSATMIIYAILANVPLGHLFIAGVMPGLLLAAMLSIVPVIMCARNPLLGRAAGRVSWEERFSSLRLIWPVVLVMFGILGSIYFGIATPTEAGGVGCFIVLVVAILFFDLRLKGLYRAIVQTAVLNSTIMIILVGSSFFTYVFGSSSVAQNLSLVIASLNMPPMAVIVAIMFLLLVLGCFIDGITIMMLTIPIFVPIITELGFDPVWFGILFVINMEIALITPPMGINFFLVRNNFDISSMELLKGVFPFLIMLVIFLAITVIFPQISLWLPGLMRGN
ncbi:MAG: TRAP transporter large permease subunit [Desulfatiglans sp.]|nr:TRAP transporter large permease subunit [Desulfatiglans sp.]